MNHLRNAGVLFALCLGLAHTAGSTEVKSWSEAALGLRAADVGTPDGSIVGSAISIGGGVTYYTSEAEFLAAGLNLTTDNLNSSLTAPASVCVNPTPLSSATNDSCFASGDLQPGYVFNALGGLGQYALETAGAFGLPANAIGPNSLADDSEFVFSPEVDAFGATLHGDLLGPVTATIELFDAGNNSLGSVVVTGTLAGQFFGFVSRSAKIARVTLTDPSLAPAGAELVSALHYGDLVPPVPTLGAWAMLLLCAMLGLVGWRHLS